MKCSSTRSCRIKPQSVRSGSVLYGIRICYYHSIQNSCKLSFLLWRLRSSSQNSFADISKQNRPLLLHNSTYIYIVHVKTPQVAYAPATARSSPQSHRHKTESNTRQKRREGSARLMIIIRLGFYHKSTMLVERDARTQGKPKKELKQWKADTVRRA